MLKYIFFVLPQKTADSDEFQRLLPSLDLMEIRYGLYPEGTPYPMPENQFRKIITELALPSEHCLYITHLAESVAFAKSLDIPCIGYSPSELREDLSGAYALFEDFASINADYLRRTHAHALGYPAEILTTERLTVREFSDEDFPTLYTMCTVPSTAFFMEDVLSDYETEQEKHNAYIRNVYPFFDLALWGVFEKASGKLIGRAGFSLPEDDSDTFSVGYLIDIPYRRRGYAKELIPALLSYAKEQGYSRISARIKQENVVSVKTLEQCGFPYERTKDSTEGIITYLIHLTT